MKKPLKTNVSRGGMSVGDFFTKSNNSLYILKRESSLSKTGVVASKRELSPRKRGAELPIMGAELHKTGVELPKTGVEGFKNRVEAYKTGVEFTAQV